MLALRYYCTRLLSRWRMAVPALTLPALGNICLFYLVPLAGHLAGDGDGAVAVLLPYVLGFGAMLLAGEVLWRIGLHFLNRPDAHRLPHLRRHHRRDRHRLLPPRPDPSTHRASQLIKLTQRQQSHARTTAGMALTVEDDRAGTGERLRLSKPANGGAVLVSKATVRHHGRDRRRTLP
ncbi:hypothetical protein [Streptosporangium roseum]|uniref:hypothetical protein n=1 Tax=Streptosporangium roseum TaxID=2001 RepID=UPI00333326D3